ncbi:MAG: GNAT family N-acetyltransferase [Acidimicrobiales bacterium]
MLSVLRLEDAEEMVSVLDDEGLYEFIGGVPPSLKELRSRYEHFLARPERTHETWLNWIVRRASDTVAIGTLQATLVTTASGQAVAEVSWVIGTRWHKQGFASEAARALVGWLRERGIAEVCAHIDACHHASAVVADRAGLHATAGRRDGEVLWRTG